MIELPSDSDGVPVIRTDFSDDAAWQVVRDAVAAEDYTGSGYEPNLAFVERRDLAALDAEALVAQIPTQYPDGYEQPFLIVVDAVAIASPEHPVLLVDLQEEDTSPPFRALPREIAAIEANLSIANLDFSDFGDSAQGGVFRGFD